MKYQTLTHMLHAMQLSILFPERLSQNIKRILDDNVTRPVWEEEMCKELGRSAQGYKDTEGTNTITFMKQEDIKNIPKDQTVTYARIDVNYQPQKKIQIAFK